MQVLKNETRLYTDNQLLNRKAGFRFQYREMNMEMQPFPSYWFKRGFIKKRDSLEECKSSAEELPSFAT
ncbi:hypothetical protein P9D34_07405 [Bacillus swezeyi]|uniref:Uncharacterized protein n=1 Tax=Bacillus swezeyi TaxID=1925020 RepID=A0A1R1S383_9BACI|nr:hypothetical protein [Bacillus swezeyi]MEC1260278.1 hypothetical protein [Bacillus swezeyi]MED2929885.1 hypothetical protein [Bacillus swezeyi]MED2964701.1 hypothetical protein [Bacillus swezeyi]MED3073018.1 hypothetical protein [Bacillus swezeyi]MED3083055.1 hypothetical protein [Bacillus swezeyi]